MEQTYLKKMTMRELLDSIAKAHAGEPFDIYEQLPANIIDKTTNAIWDFINAVNQRKK